MCDIGMHHSFGLTCNLVQNSGGDTGQLPSPRGVFISKVYIDAGTSPHMRGKRAHHRRSLRNGDRLNDERTSPYPHIDQEEREFAAEPCQVGNRAFLNGNIVLLSGGMR